MDTILHQLRHNQLINITINKFGMKKNIDPTNNNELHRQHTKIPPIISTTNLQCHKTEYNFNDIIGSSYNETDGVYSIGVMTGDIVIQGLDDESQHNSNGTNTVLDELRTPLPPSSPPPVQSTAPPTSDYTLSSTYLYQSMNHILHTNTSLVELNLSSNQLNSNDALVLSTMLQHNHSIQYLNLSYNRLLATGISYICNSLLTNNTVTKLYIGGNGILDDGGISVGNMLTKNRSLRILDITNGGLYVSGCCAIFNSLQYNNTLHTLVLARNAVIQQGSVAAGNMLLTNNTLRKLDLSACYLYSDGMNELCRGVQGNKSLYELLLHDNEIGDVGCKSLFYTLKYNTALQYLSVSDNDLHETSGKYISDLLRRPTCTLKTLVLSDNELGGKGIDYIAQSMKTNQSLHTLNLANNKIDVHGSIACKSLSKYMKYNTTLHILDLSWNRFGIDGTKYINELLIRNQSIQKLDLSHNKITDQGVECLVSGITGNHSIQQFHIDHNHMSVRGIELLCSCITLNSTILSIKYEQGPMPLPNHQPQLNQPIPLIIPVSPQSDQLIQQRLQRNTKLYQQSVKVALLSCMSDRSIINGSSIGRIYRNSSIGDIRTLQIVFDMLFGTTQQQNVQYNNKQPTHHIRVNSTTAMDTEIVA